MKCGKPVMVDAYPTRKENGGYVLKVLPCENCASKSGVETDAESRCNCNSRGFSQSTGGCPIHGVKY